MKSMLPSRRMLPCLRVFAAGRQQACLRRRHEGTWLPARKQVAARGCRGGCVLPLSSFGCTTHPLPCPHTKGDDAAYCPLDRRQSESLRSCRVA
eukprot:scaffold26466_cov63-Phaeocystis_antarctica.AAC.2